MSEIILYFSRNRNNYVNGSIQDLLVGNTAVSYTHLDVYKRQVTNNTGTFVSLDREFCGLVRAFNISSGVNVLVIDKEKNRIYAGSKSDVVPGTKVLIKVCLLYTSRCV